MALKVERVSKFLNKNLGKIVKVKVSVPNSEPDEFITGKANEIYDHYGMPTLIMIDVICEGKEKVSRDMYKIGLYVICQIQVLKEENLPIKKAAP